MQQVIQIASELYLILLCLFAGPADQPETRIDKIGSRGLIDSLLVQRTGQGFSVYDEKNGQRVLFVTLTPEANKPGVFVALSPNGRKEMVDLSAELGKLETFKARRSALGLLHTQAGNEIRISRSGSLLYVNEPQSERTYVVQASDLSISSGSGTNANNIRVYALKNVSAARLSSVVKAMLGDAGTVRVDERTQSLVVTTSPELQNRLARMVPQLDVKP